MSSLTFGPKDREKLPDWAVRGINEVEGMGFNRWILDLEYANPDPATVKRIQVRDEAHVGQAYKVNLYAEAMKRGDKFAPGVVDSTGRIVDFNTRNRAAWKLGWPTFPVIVIQESYDNADPFTKTRFAILGGGFNGGGPEGLTRPELTRLIRLTAADPSRWTVAHVAEKLHVPQKQVQGIFAEFRAEARAEKLGVPMNGSVKPTTKEMLGQRSEKLADATFREIIGLVQDTGMPTSEARDLCRQVIGITTGDDDRMSFLSGEREGREGQIAAFKGGGKRRPPLSSHVRRHANFYIEHSDNARELADANPNTRDEFLDKIEVMAGVLTELVQIQRELKDTPVPAASVA